MAFAIRQYEQAFGIHVSPPSWTFSRSSRLSQSAGFGCPASCIRLALAIYFTYGNMNVLCCAWSLTCVQLFVTPWTVACQAPLSMGILQARILEWVAMPSSRGSSQPRDQTQVSGMAVRFFTIWAIRDAQVSLLFSQIIPPSSPRVQESVFHICICFAVLNVGSSHHLSRFHMYSLIYGICLPLSDLLRAV